jgi:hypothetical protein
MARFFLNMLHGGEYVADIEGSDLPDLATAISEARAAAREILAERLRTGQPLGSSIFQICDEAGTVRASLDFKDAYDDQRDGALR